MAQQLVEPQQRLLELGAAPDSAVAAARLAGAAAAPTAARLRCRRRPAPRPRPACSASSAAQGALARRLGDRTTEVRSRRQHDGAIEARLDALRFEPRRRCSGGVLEQAGGNAGGGAQDDRALDLRGDDGAGGIPERGRVDERPKRVRLGGHVVLADQRRGEGLQLAQLPLRGAVDELHGARDLDVDLDARFVHQLEAEAVALGLAGRRFSLRVEVLGDLPAQRVDEGLLVQRRLALQRRHDVGIVDSLAGARRFLRWAEQLDRADDDAADQGRRQGQLVVDEALKDRSDRHARSGSERLDYLARPAREPRRRRRSVTNGTMKKGCRSSPLQRFASSDPPG